MRPRRITSIALLTILVCGQRPVESQELDKARRLTSVIVVSPMVGKGTYDDPRRPAVMKAAEKQEEGEQVASYRYLISDDGRSAIVEISGLDGVKRADLRTRTDLVTDVIEKEQMRKEDAESVLKRVKKDFRWEDLAGVRVPVEVGK